MRGFLHLYNGQEAILAGALHVMELGKDRMITAYRNHVQPIGLGPKKGDGRIVWKSNRNPKRIRGFTYIFSKAHRFHGGHGIVGGQPAGAGMAFGDKYHNTGVTLFYGRWSIRQGSLHETLNLATLNSPLFLL